MENQELKLREELRVITPKRKHAFRLQGKNFFLTYPKCEKSKEQAEAFIRAKVDYAYICIAQELHLDGTPHIHILVCLKEKKQISSETYWDIGLDHGNYQVARDSDDVLAYVRKSDKTCLEIGEYCGNNPSKVQKLAKQNKLILESSLPDLVDKGEVSLYNYKQLRDSINLYRLDKITVPDYMPKECIWIYGGTGIGKSRYIRDNFGGQVYYKAQNKWWDGYKGQSIVLIDDFDLGGECLGHYLKIWGDCYCFNAEIKGGTIQPVYSKMFITSQYLPDQIWCKGNDASKWDTEMRDAVLRRFKVYTIVDGNLVVF